MTKGKICCAEKFVDRESLSIQFKAVIYLPVPYMVFNLKLPLTCAETPEFRMLILSWHGILRGLIISWFSDWPGLKSCCVINWRTPLNLPNVAFWPWISKKSYVSINRVIDASKHPILGKSLTSYQGPAILGGWDLPSSQARTSLTGSMGWIFSPRIFSRPVVGTSNWLIRCQKAKSKHFSSCIKKFRTRADDVWDGEGWT